MATSNPIDLAADIVKSFVSNNSVPRGELAALIEAVHAAVKRLAGRRRGCPGGQRAAHARRVGSQVGHPGLSDLPGRRRTIQISAPASGDARDDAGAVSREMEPAFRLSHGRAQLRGAAVGAGEEPRARAIAPEARCHGEPSDGAQVPLRRRRAPARSRLPPSHRRAPTRSTRPRTERQASPRAGPRQEQEQEQEQGRGFARGDDETQGRSRAQSDGVGDLGETRAVDQSRAVPA